MFVPPVSNQSNVNFGYSHPLKTMWMKGKLPTVKIGLYNDVLTKKNCTLEHIKCHSKGGKTKFDNLAVASKRANNLRGNKDIREFLTPQMAYNYLKQFLGLEVKHNGNTFIGNKYIEDIIRRLEGMGVDLSKFHKKLL